MKKLRISLGTSVINFLYVDDAETKAGYGTGEVKAAGS